MANIVHSSSSFSASIALQAPTSKRADPVVSLPLRNRDLTVYVNRVMRVGDSPVGVGSTNCYAAHPSVRARHSWLLVHGTYRYVRGTVVPSDARGLLLRWARRGYACQHLNAPSCPL